MATPQKLAAASTYIFAAGRGNGGTAPAANRIPPVREPQIVERKGMTQDQFARVGQAGKTVPQQARARSPLKSQSRSTSPCKARSAAVGTQKQDSTDNDLNAQKQESETYTDLQMELKELRTTLENKRAQHMQIGAPVQTRLLTGEDKHVVAQHVQKVQDVASEALEHEVKALCTTVGSLQAEQALFVQMVMGEIDALKEQVKAPRELAKPEVLADSGTFTAPQMQEMLDIVTGHQQWKMLQEKTVQSVHSELDTLTLGFEAFKQELSALRDLAALRKSNADPEIKQLRLEMEDQFSHQQLQLKSCDIEIQKVQELTAESGLTLSKMMAALDSEMKILHHELREKEVQACSAAENRLLEIYNSLQGQQMEALGTVHQCQLEMERRQSKQEEEYTQAMKRSTDLTMHMQQDMTYLRDLLEKSSAIKQSDACPQESVQMMKTLLEEVEILRNQHQEIRAETVSKASSLTPLTVQMQAELNDLRTATEAQWSHVDAVQQQLNDQRAQLGALGTASKVVAGVGEAEVLALRTSFEEQLQQHTEAIKALSRQMASLSDNLPTQPLMDTPVSVTGQDCDITLLKNEVNALKLQSTLQRSLRSTEVANEAAAIHGQLHKVIGNERDSRIQESIEMRALIKNLYSEVAQITQHLKAKSGDKAASELNNYTPEMMEPLEIKRLMSTELSRGDSTPDTVDCSSNELPTPPDTIDCSGNELP